MKEYYEFESMEDYLRHAKKFFYKTGMKCMVLSLMVLLIMFYSGKDKVGNIIGITENMFWAIQKATTGCFCIGAIGYLVSFTIKIEQ